LPLFLPLLKCCLFPEDRQSHSVCVNRGLIHGLACLRSRRGPAAWEVEDLLLTPGHEGCCLGLLERTGPAIDNLGAERIFLRLDSGSPAVDVAKSAGFSQHLTEHLYRMEEQRTEPPSHLISLRLGSSEDEYRLFRLYSSAVPLQVRTVEGMTFQEWEESLDRGQVREWVYEDGGEIKAWLRIRLSGTVGQFEIVSGLGAAELGRLVDCARSLLSGRDPVYCLVAEYQQQLRGILQERGFRQEAEYSCLNKQLVARVREPQFVPLQA